MKKRWSKIWGAGIGFVLVAGRTVIPEGIEYQWDPSTWGYLIGTGFGAGLIGALVGWFICALQNRRAGLQR